MALATGQDFDDALEVGAKSSLLGLASGFGYGAYNAYLNARMNGVNPWNEEKNPTYDPKHHYAPRIRGNGHYTGSRK